MISKADPVIAWMLDEGHAMRGDTSRYWRHLCEQIVSAGIPVARLFCGVRTLHPLVGARGFIWHRDSGELEQRAASWDQTETEDFIQSPFTRTATSGEPFHSRLDTDAPLGHPILEELRAEGMTDYLALPITFSDGMRNGLSFQTDSPGGFSADDVAALTRVAGMMSFVVEAEVRNHVARQVLDTYVGRRTGRRILEGGIRRGFAETIEAVVWISDLRGFTALAELLPRDDLLNLLDRHFDILVGAIEDAGGEVLKFLGDGLMAIFEVDASRTADACCRAALDAMAAARTASDAAAPDLDWSLALDIGEVSYGNIGGATRLDFTVIGPAVNHAARLEDLAGALGEPVLISQAFASAAGMDLRDLGTHTLRGVATPQAVFAPPRTG